MKTGLVTFYYAHHYGAQLQAYALMQAIRHLGSDCEIIDYVRKDTLEGSSIFQKGLSPKGLLRNLNSLVHYPSKKRRYDRFNAFIEKHMDLGEAVYRSPGELEANPPVCDRFVCGSDQVWNPAIYSEKDFDPAFFLTFTDKPKIAYAPSFGIASIPEGRQQALRSYLEDFDSLSVREREGAAIIRELTGDEVPVVLDPTLLLDDAAWSKVARVPKAGRKPYLLCYFVTDARPYFSRIEALARQTGLEPLWLSGNRHAPKGFRKIQDAGPEEFLGLVKGASLVCTNSFHGTVFSILFKREFYCFSNLYKYAEPASGTGSLNSRVGTLLDGLGLISRYIASPEAQEKGPSMAPMADPIDYHAVEESLGKARQASLAYLSEALRKPSTMK